MKPIGRMMKGKYRLFERAPLRLKIIRAAKVVG